MEAWRDDGVRDQEEGQVLSSQRCLPASRNGLFWLGEQPT